MQVEASFAGCGADSWSRLAKEGTTRVLGSPHLPVEASAEEKASLKGNGLFPVDVDVALKAWKKR